jgi:hypothetical protein
VLVRFKPEQGKESSLRKWVCEDALPRLAAKAGLGSVHLFEGTVVPAMTNEQRIRGADAGIDWALVATGYSREVLAVLVQHDTFKQQLAEHGAAANPCLLYQLEYSLSADEIDPRRYGQPDPKTLICGASRVNARLPPGIRHEHPCER